MMRMNGITIEEFESFESMMEAMDFVHPTEEEIEEMQRAFDRDYGDLS